MDFTIVDFQFLVVLLKSANLVVFDCEPLLQGNSRMVRYMMTVQLEGKEFSRVEALEEGVPRSILVLGKQASSVLLVSFSDFECTL